MDDPTAGGFLAMLLCRVFTPGCWVYDLNEWVLVMGVPISTAIAGGLIFPRWWNAFLVGALCFVLHVACRTALYYIRDGDLYIPYLDSDSRMLPDAASVYVALMAIIALSTQGMLRLALWAGVRAQQV